MCYSNPKPLSIVPWVFFCPVLKIQGERLLVFKFRWVIQSTAIVQWAIRTFSFVCCMLGFMFEHE